MKPANSLSKQQGVMLLEALVGILIFSIGILAMLGMQAVGMRNTIDSKYRSEAAYLANQIVGTMWVDRANIASYDDAGAGNARRAAWVAKVVATLPQDPGDPTITAPSIAIAGRQATVIVRWERPGETTVSSYSVVAQINDPT
jgi:type IV pilus assembly protein PilV